MVNPSVSPSAPARGHRVRELVCAYRPLRDGDGRVVDVPTVVLKDPRTAAAVLAPLIADQPVEVSVSRASPRRTACSPGMCFRAALVRAHLSRCRMSSCPRVSHRARLA